jgi:hypothetical protein
MDSFEKLMKRLYQEKKADDEQSIPDLKSLVDRPHKAKPETPIRAINVFWKVAASTAAAAIMTVLVWRAFDRGSSKKLPLTGGDQPISRYASATTDRLLNTGNGMTNIWDWKSPTENLLDRHHEFSDNKKILQPITN